MRPNSPGDAFWMPFTSMRAYPDQALTIVAADGMYYVDDQGRRILDAMAGLWCVNAGHGQPAITAAIREAAGTLDFVSAFRMGHAAAPALAERLAALAPDGLDHVFFTNSGSEAVDTALKIARAYHRMRGDGGRTKLIGRAKGYHGMGFGGLSVSGIGRHKRDFGPLLPEVLHLPLPYDDRMRFPHGCPPVGAEYADALSSLLTVHDPATVAAVIVEPVTGSGGVYPPPVGYLEQLRRICDRHGILLIFDEVITGFGRLGGAFAAGVFQVTPDLITCAKGLTNGTVPMGAVIVREAVYDAFIAGAPDGIEFMHGYTYSGHPLACAAALATLDVFAQQDLMARSRTLAPIWDAAIHRLDGAPGVVDVRTIGLLAAIELEPWPGHAGAIGTAVAARCLADGVLVRASGDMIVLSPPLTISEAEMDRLAETLARTLAALSARSVV